MTDIEEALALAIADGSGRRGRAFGKVRVCMSAQPAPARVTIAPPVVAGIDFLRGVFSILVVVAHALEYAFATFPVHGPLRTFAPWLDVTLGGGSFSVRGFFVVSGFCINLSVLNSVASGSYSTGGYVLARASRIYPMYLAALAAAVAAWWINGLWLPGEDPLTGWFDWPAFLSELVMTQGFSHCFLFYSASWTLTSEVIYYALWPLAIKGFGGPGGRTAIGAALGSIGTALVIVAAWKIVAGGAATSWMVPFWTVLASAPLWFAGAGMAACWNRWSSSRAAQRLRPLTWPLLLAAYALQGYVGFQNPKAWINVLHQYACVPAYLLLILWFQPLPAPGKATQAICRYLGELSYPLYLLHYPVIAVTGAFLKHFGLCRNPWSAFVVVVLASLLVSGLPGIALETAVMRWRKGLLRAHGLRNPVDALLKPVSIA